MSFKTAKVSWDAADPVNDDYGDCYFSATDGLAEAELVFLQANRIEARLRSQAHLVIGELGFGTGLNFLATWALHRRTPDAGRLIFVSTEAHPLPNDDLVRAHAAFPQFAESAKLLRQSLPQSSRGFHQLQFDGGKVTLLLLFGDAADSLAELDGTIDAWYLDGFSPAKNPAMWSPAIFAEIARLSKTGTTFGTWCAAGFVRRGLAEVGFEVRRESGHGNKRHRSEGTFGDDAATDSTPPWQRWPQSPRPATAAIIGAGLAGTATATALSQRGIQVTVYDAAPTIAAGASGNDAGLVLPPLQANANPVSDWQLMAHFLACQQLRDSCHAQTLPIQLAGRRAPTREIADSAIAAHGLPLDFIQWHDDKPTVTGLVVNPAAWCRDRLAAIDLRLNSSVTPTEIDADVVIDCRGPAADAPGIRPVRGQLVAFSGPPPTTAYAGDAYLIPTPDGAILGATFQPDDLELDYRTADQAELIETFTVNFGTTPLAALIPNGGRVALRACSRDYLPVIGPIPDPDFWHQNYARALRHGQPHEQLPAPQFLSGRYVCTGLGSHGIAGSLLAAELLTAHLCGDPIPVPRSLRSAVSATRHLTRELCKSR